MHARAHQSATDRRHSGSASSRRHGIFRMASWQRGSSCHRRGRRAHSPAAAAAATAAAVKATAPLQPPAPLPTLHLNWELASLMTSSLDPGGKTEFSASRLSESVCVHVTYLNSHAANCGKCVKLSGAGGCSLFALLDLSVR